MELVARNISFWEYLINGLLKVNGAYQIFMVFGLCLGIYGLFYHKRHSRILNLISVYLVSTTCWEAINFYSAYLYKNNMLAFKVYDFLEVIIMSIILYSFMPRLYRLYVKSQSVVVVILGVVLGFWFVDVHESGEYASIVFGAHIILLCAIYFYKVLDELYDKKLEVSPAFWIASGILIYQSISFLILGTMSLREDNIELKGLWILAHIARLLMYFFFAYAFYLTNKKWTQ